MKPGSAALSEDLHDLEDILHALGEVAERERRSSRKRRAMLTAIKALSFAFDPTRILDFHRFLLDWPGELTPAQEQHMAEVGLEDKRATPRRTKRRRPQGRCRLPAVFILDLQPPPIVRAGANRR